MAVSEYRGALHAHSSVRASWGTPITSPPYILAAINEEGILADYTVLRLPAEVHNGRRFGGRTADESSLARVLFFFVSG